MPTIILERSPLSDAVRETKKGRVFIYPNGHVELQKYGTLGSSGMHTRRTVFKPGGCRVETEGASYRMDAIETTSEPGRGTRKYKAHTERLRFANGALADAVLTALDELATARRKYREAIGLAFHGGRPITAPNAVGVADEAGFGIEVVEDTGDE